VKTWLFLSALLVLAGCQSTGGGPTVDASGRRFTIPYDGVDGTAAAQSVCVGKGYATAVVVRHDNRRVTFYCATAAERTEGRRLLGHGRIVCMDAPSGAKVCGRFD